ncbi:DUF3224 domain-containing protein [Streptomyces sp. NPDC005931]|uniref:DUF3224 domain-containing protein n=1 Tax=Streptomyces sp. NPDC005931 TaxID=3364737 RepID=UPI0036C0AC08
MTSSRTTVTGHFTFADWKETPVGPEGPENPGSPGDAAGAEAAYPRLAHATVTNAFSGGIEAEATVCDYAIAYLTKETGTFAGMERVTGRVDGRAGTFVAEERGVFAADGTVRCTLEVVEGSGTGELTGLRGSGGFTYRHGEEKVAYAFAYELE